MKKSILLLTVCLALSNCSTSIESKSNQKSSFGDRSSWISKGGYQSIDYDNFILNQIIIRGELLTRLRGRVTDIVPQLSERMKSGTNLLETEQEPWTYGIELTSPRMSQKSYQKISILL